ncbi:hypothetical protein P153DRAFT_277386, partial [Dothidotthia symphoricarpi CBS 119687]
RRITDTTHHLSVSILEPLSRKSDSHLGNLQEDFDSAIPAEEPTCPSFIWDHRYPSLRALRTDMDIGDGLWICCHCRHENILRHFKGRFPFKHLRCNRCDRTLCSSCHTSEILSPLPYGLVQVPEPSRDCELRYCHVCSNCGLSHRAERAGTTLDCYGVVCTGCGVSSYGDWPRYYIGSVESYRRDPDAAFARLGEKKA